MRFGDKEIDWKEMLYKEDLNIAYPLIRNLCMWTIINMPDLSCTFGWKRKLVNIGLLFLFIYLSVVLFIEGITIFGIIVRILLISAVTTLVYSKLVAYSTIKFMDVFQERLRKILEPRIQTFK